MNVIYDTIVAANTVVNNVAAIDNISRATFFGRKNGFVIEKGMFNHYESIAAFQNGLRAPLAMPIICLQMSASCLLDAFKRLALTALHLVTLSPINAYNSLKLGLVGLLFSATVALRIIFDAIRASIVLVTRSISTVSAIVAFGLLFSGLGVLNAGAAVGSAIKGVFIKRPEHEDVSSPREQKYSEPAPVSCF